ncbi:hypothetical protein ACIGFK_29230 [Streptomyces sp. NPDC085524]|uniref:hypothetical protein n=1 Tax=Streptomyces sp. NPDC085524 TaxID=3365728 RepID=UPI0037D0DC76
MTDHDRDRDRDLDRDRQAFIAPLVSTLLTLPLALASLFFAGISPMACDSCGEQAADAFDASFGIAWPVFMAGLVIVAALLVWCWALPWRKANAARRAGIAIAAPAVVVLNTVVFWALLDLP